jgi:hypothetical protein
MLRMRASCLVSGECKRHKRSLNVAQIDGEIGRKNFLFAGSDYGGQRAAAMYTLLGSAKLGGLDPELYVFGEPHRLFSDA